ncbi:MAG: tRNA (adenosine(37)-N6)-dimethylallyltransferase MiaA [Bacteroidota bacterium]|nr:tRNA (adenosine(37)-N6)-dimethylallyltransferase MiaA [Bacteroidota bacterium]
MQKTLLVINGQTAIGKTELALAIATHYQTEIISTDSRQFYKEMKIGTAKPSPEELSVVKHHFINSQSIHHLYSAGAFEKEALNCLEDLFLKHDIVIAIGGSGLYIKALCEGLDKVPDADLYFRKQLIAQYEARGIEPLQNMLREMDPERWLSIDQQNPQRLMRAIEIAHQNVTMVHSKKPRPFRILKLGLIMDRNELYQRINERVENMMQEGLLEEAKSLFPFRELNALKTVGYNEIFEFLEGKITLEKAVELIKQHTRNYAKRQLTWFKKDKEIHWFEAASRKEILIWLTKEMSKPN